MRGKRDIDTTNNNAGDPRLLIDGYNLLFQSNLVGKSRGAGWLERGRDRLRQLLETKLSAADCRATLIVYDASRREDSSRNHVTPQGITVTFATAYPEADDLLEEIIRRHSHPKQLRVVSSDQRIRRRARARRAESVDVESFLGQLDRFSPSSSVSTPLPDSDPPLSESEIAFWLDEFDPNREPPFRN